MLCLLLQKMEGKRTFWKTTFKLRGLLLLRSFSRPGCRRGLGQNTEVSEAGVSQTTQLSPEVQGDGTQTSPRARAASEQRREPRPAAQTPLQRGASFSPGDLRAAETEQLLCAQRSPAGGGACPLRDTRGPVHSGTRGRLSTPGRAGPAWLCHPEAGCTQSPPSRPVRGTSPPLG